MKLLKSGQPSSTAVGDDSCCTLASEGLCSAEGVACVDEFRPNESNVNKLTALKAKVRIRLVIALSFLAVVLDSDCCSLVLGKVTAGLELPQRSVFKANACRWYATTCHLPDDLNYFDTRHNQQSVLPARWRPALTFYGG